MIVYCGANPKKQNKMYLQLFIAHQIKNDKKIKRYVRIVCLFTVIFKDHVH